MSIVNISEPYAIDLADSLIAALNGSGIALNRVDYIKGSFDPTALVEKLDGSMAVFIPSYNYELVTFLREVGKRFPGGKGPQVYTGDTTGSRDDFFTLLGAGAEVDLPPVYFTNGYADELMGREYAAFSAAYRKRFGIAPEGAAAVAGYEAGLAMAELARLGPASAPGALVGRELRLPLGTTAFGTDHLLRRPVTVNKIRNSRFKLLRLFRPGT